MAVLWRRLFRRWRSGAPTYGEFYAEDERRRRSEELVYGSGWRDESDPGATWELRWFEMTGELCAMRHPGIDFITVGGESTGVGSTTLGTSYTVKVLGVVESRVTLERLLAGWDFHMGTPDGLRWLRERLDGQPR